MRVPHVPIEERSNHMDRTRTTSVVPVLVLMGAAISGCSLIGPSCLERRETGPAARVSGVVDAGNMSVHELVYAVEGSQNNLALSWVDQFALDGPRIRVYATRVECEQFEPDRPSGTACANLGGGGFSPAPGARACVVSGTCQPTEGELVQVSLTITNGRGNPDVLGPSGRFKLWVVGDHARSTRYDINGTWFYGPDC